MDRDRSGTLVILLAVVALLASVSAVSPGASADPGIDTTAVDRFVTDQLHEQHIPGASLTIVEGEDTYTQGYGTTSAGTPVTAATPFRLASLSKSFTAVCVLHLAESHRLRLDDPVAHILPDFSTRDPRSRSITVRQLLNQISGVSDSGFPLPDANVTMLSERVAALEDGRLASDPGTSFHYSDTNYAILARVVEVASSQAFDDYLSTHVLAPLHMGDTTSTQTAQQAVFASPALDDGHIQLYGAPVARPELNGFVGGSSGVISTAGDLGAWLRFHLGSGSPLLTADDLALAHQPPVGVSTQYAMGWTRRQVGDTTVLEHTGVLSTYYAYQAIVPAGGQGGDGAPSGTPIGIAMLFNTYHGLLDFTGITDGVLLRLTHQTPAKDDNAWRAGTLWVLIAGTAVAIALGITGVIRAPRWARRRRAWWATSLAFTVQLLPTAVLLGLPWLILTFVDRRFTHVQLGLALPELMVLLIAASLAGLCVSTRRLIAMSRRRGPTEQTGAHRPNGGE